MDHLDNKTIVITGASRGIGAATARHLSAKGANVVLGARSGDRIAALAAEINQGGGRAEARATDVSVYEDVEALSDLAVSRFGQIDVMVNNAGLIDPIAYITESDPNAWGRVVDVNVKGVYHGLRAVVPLMRERGGGTVINISSGAATSALEGWSHYCATKAAVLSLTRCADRELRDAGVRVVGLSPGTVATDMQTAIRASGINPVSRLDPSSHIPPDWVARAIAYLCGPEGAAYSGTDFSLKDDAGRAAAGLPPV